MIAKIEAARKYLKLEWGEVLLILGAIGCYAFLLWALANQ
jgi:hypothetical protein